jgi:hypothetical protein
VRRATSVSWPATEAPRAPADFARCAGFGVAALWRCDLAGLPPALERRLIAFPKAQDKASCRFKLAHWKRPGAVLCVTANFDREWTIPAEDARSPGSRSEVVIEVRRAARGISRTRDDRPRAGWINRLEQGLKSGAALPATAAAVLGKSALYGHHT